MIKSCGYPIIIIRFLDGECRINVVMYLKQIRKRTDTDAVLFQSCPRLFMLT